ncbi:hypothetical protein [Vibrio neptunius]|uniref:hypothetical protein n=1 Tax=Vibrio neptunius TaxID=170651 RepID=UPI0019CFC9AD|nr:hypothetical protein [Vibrio neptunius]MBN3573071.1 hypothetical protein [Vibrio neptunius]
MTEPNIERINQHLTQASLATLTSTELYDDIWDVLDAILEDSSCSEETNFERIRVLLKAGIISDCDVLEYYNHKVEHMDLSYECCPLVKILAPLERDGTLYLSGSERIYQLSWDLYADYIKNIILLGGRVDHDAFLCEIFSGEQLSFDIFNFLIDRFDFKPSSINTAAGFLVLAQYFEEYGEEEQGRAAFKKLIEKGIDINLPFEESDGLSDYRSFLGCVFCCEPDVFEQYLALNPDKKIIDNMNWRFMFGEHDIDKRHIDMIVKLVRLGYRLPLNEIVDCLERYDFMDLAHTVRQLAI